jgi:hypothetical protein
VLLIQKWDCSKGISSNARRREIHLNRALQGLVDNVNKGRFALNKAMSRKHKAMSDNKVSEAWRAALLIPWFDAIVSCEELKSIILVKEAL